MTIDREALNKMVLSITSKDERTFGDFFQYFDPERVQSHDLSEALQDLTVQGKIIQQRRGQETFYHTAETIEDRIKAKSRKIFVTLLDSLKPHEWGDLTVTPTVPYDAEKYSMSAFLVHCSLIRRKSWKEEGYDDWRHVKGTWTRKDEEVSLHLSLTNNDVDHFEMYGIFRRPKGEPFAVAQTGQMNYVKEVFYNWMSLAGKTQNLTAFATTIRSIAQGRAKVLSNLVGYLEDLDISEVPPAYRASVSPMMGYFNAERKGKHIGLETYMRRHAQEHIPYINHVLDEFETRGIPSHISPE